MKFTLILVLEWYICGRQQCSSVKCAVKSHKSCSKLHVLFDAVNLAAGLWSFDEIVHTPAEGAHALSIVCNSAYKGPEGTELWFPASYSRQLGILPNSIGPNPYTKD